MLVDASDDYEMIDEKALDDRQDVAIITPADSPSYDDAAMDTPTALGAQEEEEADEPLADDPDAMMAKYMGEVPDLEVEAEGHYTFTIEDWGKLGKREHGPGFHVGGVPWWVVSHCPRARLNANIYPAQARPVLSIFK